MPDYLKHVLDWPKKAKAPFDGSFFWRPNCGGKGLGTETRIALLVPSALPDFEMRKAGDTEDVTVTLPSPLEDNTPQVVRFHTTIDWVATKEIVIHFIERNLVECKLSFRKNEEPDAQPIRLCFHDGWKTIDGPITITLEKGNRVCCHYQYGGGMVTVRNMWRKEFNWRKEAPEVTERAR